MTGPDDEGVPDTDAPATTTPDQTPEPDSTEPIPGPRRKADDPSPNYALNVDEALATGRDWAIKTGRGSAGTAPRRRRVGLRIQVGNRVVASGTVPKKALSESYTVPGSVVRYVRDSKTMIGIVQKPLARASGGAEVVVWEVSPNATIVATVPAEIESPTVRKLVRQMRSRAKNAPTVSVSGPAGDIPRRVLFEVSKQGDTIAVKRVVQHTVKPGARIHIVEGGDLESIEKAAEAADVSLHVRAFGEVRS